MNDAINDILTQDNTAGENAMLIALVVSLALSALLVWRLIPLLKKKAGQNIREDGPEAHKKKAGTPSMGGIGIVVAAIIGTFAAVYDYEMQVAESVAASEVLKNVPHIVLLALVFFALMGFSDDYLKVLHKQNLGLTAKQKLVLQIAAGLATGLYFYLAFPEGHYTVLPFVNVTLPLGPFYILWVCFVMVAMANAVNLTDGLDGLCASVTTLVALFFALAAMELGEIYPGLSSAALCGACMGFLLFNRYPARIFMGDTGSLALGGMLAVVALSLHLEFYLVVVGLIYVLEALSVVIQVLYFKKTGGKRFFRMAPLHHHFELGGMKEQNVVKLFLGITVATTLLGCLGIRLMG